MRKQYLPNVIGFSILLSVVIGFMYYRIIATSGHWQIAHFLKEYWLLLTLGLSTVILIIFAFLSWNDMTWLRNLFK